MGVPTGRAIPLNGPVVRYVNASTIGRIWISIIRDPADCVLVPEPSYPLFEHLTRLDTVAARPYVLEYHGRWAIDDVSVFLAKQHIGMVIARNRIVPWAAEGYVDPGLSINVVVSGVAKFHVQQAAAAMD